MIGDSIKGNNLEINYKLAGKQMAFVFSKEKELLSIINKTDNISMEVV